MEINQGMGNLPCLDLCLFCEECVYDVDDKGYDGQK